MRLPTIHSQTWVILLWLYVAVAWGGSYVAVNVGLEFLPPIFFAATRLYVGALVALPLAWVLSNRLLPRERKSVLGIIVTGVFIGTGVNVFLFVGEQYASSATGAVIFGMNPILAAFFSWILIPEERPDLLGAIGLIIGIIGIGVIVGFDPAALLAGRPGQYLLVVGATSLAFGSVLSRRLNAPLEALPTMGWGLLLGGMLAHIISFSFNEQIPTGDSWTLPLLFAVGYIGVVATGVAYTAYYALLKDIEAIKAALVSYAVPVVAAIGGFLILQEPVNQPLIIGFILITAGFILVNKESIREEIVGRVSALVLQ